MYCCFTREPSFWRSRLKEIRSEETVAEYSLTGMATRPKEIVSEAIDRACVAMVPTSLKTELWSNSNSCDEKRARPYIARIYGSRVRSCSRRFKPDLPEGDLVVTANVDRVIFINFNVLRRISKVIYWAIDRAINN